MSMTSCTCENGMLTCMYFVHERHNVIITSYILPRGTERVNYGFVFFMIRGGIREDLPEGKARDDVPPIQCRGLWHSCQAPRPHGETQARLGVSFQKC